MITNICVINKEIFQKRPPVISSLLCLSDLGYNISLITSGINEYWYKELSNRNIDVFVIPDFKNRNNILVKYFEFFYFKLKVNQILKRSFITSETLVWVIGGNTVFSLGKLLLNWAYVLQIQELHEENTKYLKVFKRIIPRAKHIILNEYNRCVYYKCWFRLKTLPTVLPNKPYFIPNQNLIQELINKYPNELNKLDGRKYFIYQGHLGPERDLTNYILAIRQLGCQYGVLLVGPDHGMVEKYKKIDSSIVHIGFIPAPDYLLFTSLSYIGILSYSSDTLNNCYCAPNKIWEYAAFGLPMICNNIPGLQYTIAANNVGICIDESNIDSIYFSILKIIDGYEQYSENAREFWNSCDNEKTIKSIVDKI